MRNLITSKLWTYRLLRSLLVIIGIVIIVHMIMQTINFLLWPNSPGFVELSNRFDLDDEASIPTWVSQFMLSFAAILAFVLARMSDGQRRLAWYFVSMIVILASMDEVARLHELAVQSIHVKYFGAAGTTIIKNAWLIIVPFVVTAAGFAIFVLAKYLPKKTLKILMTATILYLTGAIGVEIISSGMNPNSWTYTTLVTAVEEGLELIGTAVLVFCIADYMNTVHHKQTQELLGILHKRSDTA
jgi:hypothetical protein